MKPQLLATRSSCKSQGKHSCNILLYSIVVIAVGITFVSPQYSVSIDEISVKHMVAAANSSHNSDFTTKPLM
jgi:hypothetical protein